MRLRSISWASGNERRPLTLTLSPADGGEGTRLGTAAVEFVIILPALIAIVIGVTDLSRVRYTENVLMNAAWTGAAYGATHQVTSYNSSDWQATVKSRVLEEAANIPGYNAAQMTVSVSTTTDADGSTRISVTTGYPFQLFTNWPGWPRQITLQHSVSVRSYR